VRVTQVFIEVEECVKYDGSTNRVELVALRLDDGRYVNTSLQVGVGVPNEDGYEYVKWTEEQVEFETEAEFVELQEFFNKVGEQVDEVGWVYTSNPEVYGYPEESFELCGMRVDSEDVNAHCKYDGCDDPGPFVLDLTNEVYPTG
jgi:hypothetical protein